VETLQKNFLGEIIDSVRLKKIRNQIECYVENKTLVYEVIPVALPKKNSSLEDNILLFEHDLRNFMVLMITHLKDLEENLEFADNFKVFAPNNLRKSDNVANDMYGDEEIKNLSLFYTTTPYSRVPVILMNDSVLQEWRIFKTCVIKMNPLIKNKDLWMVIFCDLKGSLPNLIDLIELYLLLPLSTVDCGEGSVR
jgi:folate-binding Fe-S cluster repair protein YgfZ